MIQGLKAVLNKGFVSDKKPSNSYAAKWKKIVLITDKFQNNIILTNIICNGKF
jgi:hypothetical protein